MTDTDTSAEAIESAWEEFEVSSKPTGESDGYEMFNVEGIGDDAWNIIVITRALAAERDALRLSLAEARNAALDEMSIIIMPLERQPDVDPSNHGDTAELAVWQNEVWWAKHILALKTPTGDTE